MKNPIEYLAQRHMVTTDTVKELLHDLGDILRFRRTDADRDDKSKAQHFTAENVVRDVAEGK